jgi:hypothetical protein
VLGGFETAVPNWQTGDTLIAAGNVRYRVVSVIPEPLLGEFVDARRTSGSSRSSSCSGALQFGWAAFTFAR